MTAPTHRLTPLALAIALASTPVSALTLGQLETRSALGQPFQGRIPLSNLGDTTLDEIRPKMATQDQYDQLNVREAYQHSQFRLSLIEENGRPYIEVRSPDTIDEPILNFVVNVRWPKGNMAKEFLVLLDPPSRASTRSARRAVRQPPSASGDTYRTQAGDNLWLIAQSLKPEQVSIYRAMDALYQLNPAAFINGNRDLLRRDYQLKLPSWQALPQPTQTRAPKPVLSEVQPELPALTPVAAPPAQVSASVPTSAESQNIRTRIDTVNTRVETLQTQLAENQAKLAAMQTQLEQLILLQQQLLVTQAEILQAAQTSPAVIGSGEQPRQVQPEALITAEPLVESAQSQPSETTTPVATTAETNTTPVTESQTEGAALSAAQPIAPLSEAPIEVQPATEAEPVATEPAPQPVSEQNEAANNTEAVLAPVASTAQQEQASTPPWLLYLGALVLALVLGWVVWRRRPSEGTKEPMADRDLEEEDLFDSQVLGADEPYNQDPRAAQAQQEEGESEWLQMAANDGQSTASDPLLDANIYLVYGRLDDADRLLTKALSKEPERVDLRLLQLKLYQQQNDRKRFEEAANQLEPLADEYERRQIGQLRDKFTG